MPSTYDEANASKDWCDVPMQGRVGKMIKKCLMNDHLRPNLSELDASQADLPKELELYIHETSVLPHFGVTDFVVLFDKKLKVFIPIPEEFRNYDLGDIKWLPRSCRDTNRYRWITVCVVNRGMHLMFRRPIGQTVQPEKSIGKNSLAFVRDVTRLGYSVLSIIDIRYLIYIENEMIKKVHQMTDQIFSNCQLIKNSIH